MPIICIPSRVLAIEQYEIEYTYRQEKDEKLLKFLVLFFLTSTASVFTEAILILSIYRRFARFDIFAARFASINSICFRYAQTRYDINQRSRSEHIECLRSKHHIERVSVYRKSALADLYHIEFLQSKNISN